MVQILRLPFSNGEQAAPLRHEARHALTQRLGDVEWVDDVLLVISELVQNVSQHTTGGGVLVLRAERDEVVVEVEDADPAVPVPQQPDGRRIGGRGLLLVAGVSQQWGVRPTGSGKVVWSRIPAPRLTPAAA